MESLPTNASLKKKIINKLHEWDFMVNFKYSNLLLLLGLVFLPSCWFSSEEKKLKLIMINVLPLEYYNDCHIKGSIQIPFEEVENKLSSLNKNNHYVIYCADYPCMSSYHIAQVMIQHGFNHVWEYSGGMADWYQKGYPTEGPAKEDYLTQENEPLGAAEHDVPVITAEQLLEKITEFEK